MRSRKGTKKCRADLRLCSNKTLALGARNGRLTATEYKHEFQTYLDLGEKKRAVEERIVSDERLRDDAIANGKNADEED